MRARLSTPVKAAAAFAALLSTASAAISPEQAALPSAQLITRANTLLASGLGSQALEYFDLVVERDEGDYLSLFKRATAHLALGQTKRALEDYEAVLRLTEFDQVSASSLLLLGVSSSSHRQARLQIARIHLKTGALTEAREAVDAFLKSHKTDVDAIALVCPPFDLSPVDVDQMSHRKGASLKPSDIYKLVIKLAKRNDGKTVSPPQRRPSRLRPTRSTCASFEQTVSSLTVTSKKPSATSLAPLPSHLRTSASCFNSQDYPTSSSVRTARKRCNPSSNVFISIPIRNLVA